MAIVSKMLRHSSVDTYGHMSEDTARVASDAMAALLDAAFEQATAPAGDHTATTPPSTEGGQPVSGGRQRGERAGQKGWACQASGDGRPTVFG